MKRITVRTSAAYDVYIGKGIAKRTGEFIQELFSPCGVMIVSDDNVYPVYGKMISELLSGANFTVHSHVIPHGEGSKNIYRLGEIWEAMAKEGMTRTDIILTLGGGVVGDLGGFAAATYLRGIKYVSIPTSLLAMVDSSVGGKTAIDLSSGKNLAGAFWQPSLVICDTALLSTLPAEYFRDGMAEVIKYGMINRPELLNMLEDDADIDTVVEICIDDKRRMVEEDERDNGVRRLLNFGHTFGHAIERLSDFTVPHGAAIAAGMAIITRAAAAMSLCDISVYDRLENLLGKYCLPKSTAFSPSDLASAALADKKRRGESVSLVIPMMAGKCEIADYPAASLVDIARKGTGNGY